MPTQIGVQYNWLVHDTRGLLVWPVWSVCISGVAHEYYGGPSNDGDMTSNYIYVVLFKVGLVFFIQ
jgi:hypothetical protein